MKMNFPGILAWIVSIYIAWFGILYYYGVLKHNDGDREVDLQIEELSLPSPSEMVRNKSNRRQTVLSSLD